MTANRIALVALGTMYFAAAPALAAPALAAPAPQAGPSQEQQPPPQQQRADAAVEAPTTRPVPPEVRQVLDQVKQAYSKLDALRVEGTISSDFTINGKPQKIERKFTGAFQAPNKFQHRFADELVVGSTGDKTYAHSQQTNTYLLADAPAPSAPAEDLPRPIPEILQTQNPSLMLAISQDPLTHLVTMGSELKKLEDVKIGETSYTALGAEYPGGVSVQLLFDPKTHLLRRMSARMPQQEAAAAELGAANTGPVQVETMVLDYTTVDTAPQFQPGRFAWTPPEGATNVATARPEIERGAAQRLVGQPAPDFKLTSLEGKSVSLSDLKGQIVLLDFWASWCPPCVESLPHLGRMYGQQDDGVKVLAINLMEDQAQVQSFAQTHNINVPILLDQSGEVAQKYSVGAIPQTVLIGPQGDVKRVFVGMGPDVYSEIQSTIQQLKAGGGGQETAQPAAAKEKAKEKE